MSIRKISFAPEEHYHIYNRGNSKQTIFYDDHDRMHFLSLLYLCNSTKNFVTREIGVLPYECDRGEKLVDIGAYCLMPNHFHLLVRAKEDGGVSKFMQKLATAYVMYMNNKYERSGGLFEGKFKSEHLGADRYLKYIFSYINLNPAKLLDRDWKVKILKHAEKKRLEKFLGEYHFSSYKDFLGENRPEGRILSIEVFPKYFNSPKEFLNEIYNWLSFNDLP